MKIAPCSTCGSKELFRSRAVSSGGGYAPTYLPDLGTWFGSARFRLVVCHSCGHPRFYASADAEKLTESEQWEPAG